MKISFWRIFSLFTIVSNWAASALADGKVTLDEALELVSMLAQALGVRTEFEIPKE